MESRGERRLAQESCHPTKVVHDALIKAARAISSTHLKEATEYPASSSQRSTLESRPEIHPKGLELRSLEVTIDSDDDDLSQV